MTSGVSDLTGALQLKRKSAARKRFRRLMVLVLVVLVVIALALVVWLSPLFVVRNVKVRNNELLTEEQVIAVAQVPMGVPLARVDLGAIADNVLSVGAVKEVTVGRSWPSSISIRLQERVMIFQIEDGGSYRWVDAEGTIFHHTNERTEGFIVHTATNEKRLLTDVATVVLSLSDDLKVQLTEIVASSVDQIILNFDNGKQVIWGSAEESELKAQVLPHLLPMEGNFIDVTSPGNPAIR